jgi:hypothetical protein
MGETATRLSEAAVTARQKRNSMELSSERNGRRHRAVDEASNGAS